MTADDGGAAGAGLNVDPKHDVALTVVVRSGDDVEQLLHPRVPGPAVSRHEGILIPRSHRGNHGSGKPKEFSGTPLIVETMPAGPYDDTPYPGVPSSPRLPELETEILAFWATEGTFPRSVEQRPGGDNEYVFYDGPPFANGLPHYGHLLTGFVKDAVPRYQTMRGRRVERRFGWDCHGLPAETEAEKELGVSGRGPITEYGIDRFNDYCRTSVLRYAHEWERYVTRQARWVDFRNDYKTMDLPYMESVMWALKQLWDKGLLYEGYRVLPYCWECETPLSNFEIRQDNAYRDRQDPAVTVAFELEGDDQLQLWVWTTTPWTLPSNLALAVGADIDYAVFDLDGHRVVLGAAAAAKYQPELEGATPVGTMKGAELVDRRYRPLFDYFVDTPNAFRVLNAPFVNTDEGTGIVHIAPGFGEDDQVLGEAAGIPIVSPIDDRARFTAEVPDYEGLQVFEANTPIVRDLRSRGALVRLDSYVHSYPHCWRTDTPLVYKAVSSWFVKVTAIKERMLALNQQITWVPAHMPVTGRSPATATGAHRSRSGKVTTRTTPASTCTDHWMSWKPISGFGPPISTGPTSTSSPDPTPTTRPAVRPCVGSMTCSTAGSIPGRCPSPRSTTPSRTGSGSRSTSPPISSSSTSARPAAGSTPFTCWPRRCSTSRRF